MTLRDSLLAVGVMVVWGMNFGVAKTALNDLPPLLTTGLRFSLTAALLVPFVPLPRSGFLSVFGLSLTLGSVHFALMFSGLAGIDASLAAVAIQLQVPFSLLLAWLFFGETISWRAVAGLLLAFIGMLIIGGLPRLEGALSSLVMVIAASLVWAASGIQIKKMRPMGTLTVNGWMALFTGPQLLLASWILENGQSVAMAGARPQAWVAILYMSVAVTIVGYGNWYLLIRRNPIHEIMPFTLLAPVFGVLSGLVMLGEAFDVQTAVGSILTLTGVAVIVTRRPNPVPDAGREPGDEKTGNEDPGS